MTTSYEDALQTLTSLKTHHARGQIYSTADAQGGALVGFALHSETLEPLAILEAADLTLIACHPGALVPAGALRPSAFDFPGRRRLETKRHRNGGLYTQLAVVPLEGASHVLYASHKDGVWWMRPQHMFNDGRFTSEPGIAPLDKCKILDL